LFLHNSTRAWNNVWVAVVSSLFTTKTTKNNLNVKRFAGIDTTNSDQSGNQMEFYSLEEYIPE